MFEPSQQPTTSATAISSGALPSPVVGKCGLPCVKPRHEIIPTPIISAIPCAQELLELKAYCNFKTAIANCPMAVDMDVKHIFMPIIQCLQAKLAFSGFHHDYLGQIQQTGAILLTHIRPLTHGAYKANWWYNGKNKCSTFFPESWDRKKVIAKIIEAYANPVKTEPRPNGGYRITGKTSEGLNVDILIDRKGLITSVPTI
ncbi:MAG TPA: EndoU domain-containing protein [Candidatus Babeliaceae bacterium]|nr:EndoU domain-containing protein [Candidatus Babeliaceae bacterium]